MRQRQRQRLPPRFSLRHALVTRHTRTKPDDIPALDVSRLPQFMKVLLVASPKADVLEIEDLLREQGSEVTRIVSTEVGQGSAAGFGLAVLFGAIEQDEIASFVAACRTLRAASDGGPLILALTAKPADVELLVDEGCDDFLVWPSEKAVLGSRLDLLFRRVSLRKRDAVRAAMLADALRHAERSEQRFRHLAESSNEILARFSPGGVRLYISPACRTVLGYEPDELLGTSVIDSLHPADVSKLLDAMNVLDEGASVAGAIIRLQRKDGDYAWLETICRAVRDPRTNAVEEIVTVSRDITAQVHDEHDKAERAQVEQELAAARDYFRDVLDTVPDPISVEDNERRMVLVNRAFCELVARDRASIIGHASAVIRPNLTGNDNDPWPEVADQREITMSTPSGDVRVLLEKRAVLVGRGGKRVLISSLRDVTLPKRAEAQMILSERLASLGTLAAGIAHEINNPLSFVIGNLVFVSDAFGAEAAEGKDKAHNQAELEKAVSEAMEGAQRIAGIVRDMKLFARADRETMRPIELGKVLETALRMVRSSIEKRAELVREIEAIPRVLGNEARLTQVLLNVLANALDALPDRNVAENQIRVVLKPSAEGNQVVLEVRDNGEGITASILPRVFDPFFTTKPVGEGMGLGLSISRSIVSGHGGTLDIESTPGIGTVVRMLLPAVFRSSES